MRSAVAALDGGASRLGVADIGEAIALRRAGIDAPDPRLAARPRNLASARPPSLGIELGISSFEQLLQAAAAASVDRPVGVHLKLETGLGRNGIAPEDRAVIFAEAARLERIGKLRVIGLFSHLSNTSAEDDRAGLRAFQEGLADAATAGLAPPLRHLAASHAAIALPEARLGCVRLGISMYGLSPFDDRDAGDLGLRPAMTLRASVAAVRRVRGGPRRLVRLRLPHRPRDDPRARSRSGTPTGCRGRRPAPDP